MGTWPGPGGGSPIFRGMSKIFGGSEILGGVSEIFGGGCLKFGGYLKFSGEGGSEIFGGCLNFFFFFQFLFPQKNSFWDAPTLTPRRSMRGRYASYWKAFLFYRVFVPLCKLASTADTKKNVLFHFSFRVNEAQVLVVMVSVILYYTQMN